MARRSFSVRVSALPRSRSGSKGKKVSLKNRKAKAVKTAKVY